MLNNSQLPLPSDEFSSRYLPVLGGAGALLVLLMLFYSSVAYVNFGAWCLLGGILFVISSGTLLYRLSAHAFTELRVPLVFSLLILAYLFASQFWAPYLPSARRDLAGIYPAIIGFLGILFWSRGATLLGKNALQLTVLFVFGLLVLLALSGYYQTYGTANFPGTFAEKEASLLLSKDYFSPTQLEGMLHLVREGRTSGWIGSSNIFAGFLVLSLPLGIGLVFTQQPLGVRVFGAVGVLCSLGGIILSGSRGATIAAGLFMGLSILLIPLRKKLFPAAASILLVVAFLPSIVWAQVSVFSRGVGISTLQQRIYYWEAAWSMFLKSPIIGNGVGSFEILYPIHRVVGSQETRQSHSWLFEFLSEFGIVGTLLFLVAVGWCIWSFTSKRKQGIQPLAPFVLLSVLAGMFHGLVEYTFSYAEFMLFWGMLLGILVSESVQKTTQQNKSNSVALFCSGPLILFLFGSWWMGNLVPGVVEEFGLKTDYALDDKNPGQAFGLMTQAIAWEPQNASLYSRRAYVGSLLGENPANDLKKAIQINPHSAGALEEYGLFQAQQGNLNEAVKFLEQAHKLHPLDVSHRMNLADLYLKQGRMEDVRALFVDVEELYATVDEHRRLKEYQEFIPTLAKPEP